MSDIYQHPRQSGRGRGPGGTQIEVARRTRRTAEADLARKALADLAVRTEQPYMLARLAAERATALRAAKRVVVLQNGTPVKLSRARWRVLTTALAGTGAGS